MKDVLTSRVGRLNGLITLWPARVATVALALVASAALTGIWGLDAGQGEASHAGGMSAMSIDLNTSGNTASGLGAGHVETLSTTDATLSVSPCDSVTLDVTGQGVPASNPLAGFGFTLNYNSDSRIFSRSSMTTKRVSASITRPWIFTAG
jgi:hypothetical protein